MRTELAMLFYSPIAWLILMAFAVHVSFDFCDILQQIVNAKATGRLIPFSVTNGLVLGTFGYLEQIQTVIYLYVPLLTMGVMSREYSTESIKLPYSSPVSTFQLIIGKYKALAVCALIMTLILALPVAVMWAGVPNFDFGTVAAGLLGLFLLICTYCAIGLFMSTITSYQVVAAIATLATLSVLSLIGRVGESSPLFSNITYWLSIDGRASNMIGGLIVSNDVIYFLAIIALFIWLSVAVVNNRRSNDRWFVKCGRCIVPIVVIVAVGYVSSLPAARFYYDASAGKQRTLTGESRQTLANLEGPMTVTTYVNVFSSEMAEFAPGRYNRDAERFSEYTRFKPGIKMEYVYYYPPKADSALTSRYPDYDVRQIAERVARKYNVKASRLRPADELAEQIDLAEEEYWFVRVIEWGGKEARLRRYNEMNPNPKEREITAALRTLETSPARVGFVTGHGERSFDRKGDREYSIFTTLRSMRSSLINQGYAMQAVDLAAEGGVGSDIDILVLADPREPLGKAEMKALDDYLARGGNLLVTTGAGRQQTVNPLLAQLGLKAEKGVIVDAGKELDANQIKSIGIKSGDKGFGFFDDMAGNPRTYVSMPSAVAISVTDTTRFHATPLTASAPESWIEYDTENFKDETPTLDPSRGEKQGSRLTSVALSRKVGEKRQRIMVVGSSDCFNNAELQLATATFGTRNFAMVTAAMRWLSDNRYPVKLTRPKYEDTDITVTPTWFFRIRNIYTYLIPAFIGLCGLAVWLRRRRG